MSSDKFRLFDTHCHLDFERIGDTAQVIADANKAGVERFLVPAVGARNWDKVSALAARFDGVYFALGMHPYFSDEHQSEHLSLLEQQLASAGSRCVAVGECGLDFAIKAADRGAQLALFDAQVQLAKQFGLPLVLHQRKSHQEMVKLLRSSGFDQGGVIHGFSGSLQQAHDWLTLGFAIGVGGTITYPRANKTRQTVSRLPLDTLVLETDAPDMPLNGYQGKVNLPQNVYHVLNEINNLRSESKQTIAAQIWQKSNQLFLKRES